MAWYSGIADTALGKAVTVAPRKLVAKMPKSGPIMQAPGDYLGRSVGRQQVLADLEELEGLRKTGGPAVQEARELQRSAAKGQIALQRGMDTGGRGERIGTEAAAKSYVESEAPVAITKELATQGYGREIATGAGLLAMDDSSFWQAVLGATGKQRRTQEIGQQQREAAAVGTMGQVVAMGASGGAAAKTGGVVPGVGSEDTVPARLAPGEIVIPKELSAQLMEVMSRSVGGGDVVRAQTGGVVRRDPQTGYLVEDQNAMALQTMALLKEQNERITALEKSGKGRK